MWSTKTRDDIELLELFEQSGRNVQRASAAAARSLLGLSRAARARHSRCWPASTKATGSRTRSCSRLAERGAAEFDAADVHALAGALDDIVDHAEEAADQLGLYGVEAPMEQAQQMAEILVGTADLVADSLRGLRDGEEVAQQLVEIHRRENEADRIVRAAVASLFATGIDPMMVIRWKDIYDTLESAVDACETVANVLEGITLKRAANGRH